MESQTQQELFFGSLYEQLILDPIQQGATHLTAVVGYGAASIVSELLCAHPDVSIRLIIGMAAKSGIAESDHEMYKELMRQFPERIKVMYYTGTRPVHAKAYAWKGGMFFHTGFVGSPNFSRSGFVLNQEAAVLAASDDVIALYDRLLNESVSPLDPDVENAVPIFREAEVSRSQIAESHGAYTVQAAQPNQARLDLVKSDGRIHRRGGLNWGQREGRNPNQAYIPIPVSARDEHPGFFPSAGEHVLVSTDDGRSFMMAAQGQNSKNFTTPYGNHILGLYFRRRLGLEEGAYVHTSDLANYGRTDVVFTKIDEDEFFMDFSV